MPSAITHAAVAAAAGAAFAPKGVPPHFWYVAIACSIIPDADVISFSLGIPYGHFFGHRGFFHSPFFGLLLSIVIVSLFFRHTSPFSKLWWFYLLFFFLLTASHGILDAFTNGGSGIALLSPFDSHRYFSPWTPIIVSPISIRGFFSRWGWMVIKSEILWIWLPAFFMVFVIRAIRLWVTKP